MRIEDAIIEGRMKDIIAYMNIYRKKARPPTSEATFKIV